MAVVLLQEQGTGVLECCDDHGIGILEHVQAFEWAGLCGEGSGFIHRAEHGQAMLAPGVEVIHAMAWRRVHQACARFRGDVFPTNNDRAAALEQGVAVDDASKIGPLHGGFGLKRAFKLGG